METALLGAAGLQDCVDSGMDCMPGFGSFLLLYGGGFLVLLVWIPICVIATFGVLGATSRLGVGLSVSFVLGIWLAPLIGLGVWLAYERSVGERRPSDAPLESTAGLSPSSNPRTFR